MYMIQNFVQDQYSRDQGELFLGALTLGHITLVHEGDEWFKFEKKSIYVLTCHDDGAHIHRKTGVGIQLE